MHGYFINAAAYGSVEKEYRLLYPLLKKRAAFLFEYGHILHKSTETGRVYPYSDGGYEI